MFYQKIIIKITLLFIKKKREKRKKKTKKKYGEDLNNVSEEIS